MKGNELVTQARIKISHTVAAHQVTHPTHSFCPQKHGIQSDLWRPLSENAELQGSDRDKTISKSFRVTRKVSIFLGCPNVCASNSLPETSDPPVSQASSTFQTPESCWGFILQHRAQLRLQRLALLPSVSGGL